MPKTEFGYESKQQSRQRLVNFLIRNYPKNERRDLKVVCLPGAQAKDVYDITDVLKISRSNVWGLEVNKDIFKALQSKNLGINLVNCRDSEFFRTTDNRFDVVSLDYFGQLKDQEIDSLRHLFGREVLQSRGVLHTNFYGSREAEKVRDIYQTGAVFKAATEKLKDKSFDEIKGILKKGRYENILEKGFEEYVVDIKGLREGLTRAIMTVAEKGKSNLETSDVGKILHKPDDLMIKLRESDVPGYIAQYISFRQNRPYFCDSLERYKYISDDGSPMLTDVFLFNQHRKWFDEKEYPVKTYFSGSEGKVIIGDMVVSVPDLADALESLKTSGCSPIEKKVVSQVLKVYGYSGQLRQIELIKDRQLIGSDKTVRGETNKQTLSKNKIIELLKSGRSPEWIAQEYPNTNIHQLRAYKAWITMGKY